MNAIDCGHGVKYHVGNGQSKTHHMVLLKLSYQIFSYGFAIHSTVCHFCYRINKYKKM